MSWYRSYLVSRVTRIPSSQTQPKSKSFRCSSSRQGKYFAPQAPQCWYSVVDNPVCVVQSIEMSVTGRKKPMPASDQEINRSGSLNRISSAAEGRGRHRLGILLRHCPGIPARRRPSTTRLSISPVSGLLLCIQASENWGLRSSRVARALAATSISPCIAAAAANIK